MELGHLIAIVCGCVGVWGVGVGHFIYEIQLWSFQLQKVYPLVLWLSTRFSFRRVFPGFFSFFPL